MANTPEFPSPEAAEFAFYTALETLDLDAMMAVWDDAGDVSCIHPLGPRLDGMEAVRESFRRIFASGTRLRFQINQVRQLRHDTLCLRLVVENITVLGADEQPAQPVMSTNAYRHRDGRWRMILHHASPGQARGEPTPDPDLHTH